MLVPAVEGSIAAANVAFDIATSTSPPTFMEHNEDVMGVIAERLTDVNVVAKPPDKTRKGADVHCC
jgi:hypothetical protein